MKILLIFLSFFTLNINSFAQHNFGLLVNFGLSKVSNSTAEKDELELQFALSGKIGIFHELKLSSKSILGAELCFIQIESREKTKFLLIDQYGNTVGEGTGEFHKHISYVGLPVYFGFNFSKFRVSLGPQMSMVLYGKGRDIGSVSDGFDMVWDNKFDLLLHQFEFGGTGAIQYAMSDRIGLAATYYHGISSILNSPHNWKWRVRQITIGFRYVLFAKDVGDVIDG